MTEELSIVRSIAELGLPAVVLLQVWVMWRAYERRISEHIRDLRLVIQHMSCRDLFADSQQQ